MPTISTFGAGSSRALGHIGGRSKKLKTVVFNAAQNWVAPAGVINLVQAFGYGGIGSAGETRYISYTIVQVNYRTDTSTGTGNFDWASPYSYASDVASDMNIDGAASWTQYYIDVWPDQTNTITSQSNMSDSGNNSDWSVSGPSSGPANSSDSVQIDGSYEISGQPGAVASAFGKNFPGGDSSGNAPITTIYNNVAVTPGNSYLVSVPTGGRITITYYE